MTAILDYLASALICPVAVLYMFLLGACRRTPPVRRWLFLLLCGPAAVFLAHLLAPLPIPVRIPCVWAAVLPWCWAFSAVRDARFLFTAITGVLFTYLSTAVSSMAAHYLGVHRTLLRLALDMLLLLLTALFFRPAFLRVCNLMKQGWLVFSLMPAGLMSIFLCLLLAPDYSARYYLPHVQGFTYLLALLTLSFYWASLQFFRRLGEWQEGEVDRAVLAAQVSALTAPDASRLEAEERRRILRHDLRHYLHILSSCLAAGDGPAALRTLEALEDDLRSVDGENGKGGPPG